MHTSQKKILEDKFLKTRKVTVKQERRCGGSHRTGDLGQEVSRIPSMTEEYVLWQELSSHFRGQQVQIKAEAQKALRERYPEENKTSGSPDKFMVWKTGLRVTSTELPEDRRRLSKRWKIAKQKNFLKDKKNYRKTKVEQERKGIHNIVLGSKTEQC